MMINQIGIGMARVKLSGMARMLVIGKASRKLW